MPALKILKINAAKTLMDNIPVVKKPTLAVEKKYFVLVLQYLSSISW